MRRTNGPSYIIAALLLIVILLAGLYYSLYYSMHTPRQILTAKEQYMQGAKLLYSPNRELDTETALELLNQASDRHYLRATYALAWMYQTGELIPMDKKKAAHYYTILYQAGMGQGAWMLAELYFHDQKVFPDITNEQIMELYAYAAKTYTNYARYHYAYLLMQGAMVERDEVEALKWLLINRYISPNDRAPDELEQLMSKLPPDVIKLQDTKAQIWARGYNKRVREWRKNQHKSNNHKKIHIDLDFSIQE